MHASEKTPSDIHATPCYGGSVRKASRILTRIYDDALAPSGLNLTQFSIAYRLNEVNTATISELAAWMDLDKTAMGRSLLPMEREGFIAMQKGDDRRSRPVTLTAAGLARYRKAIPLWQQAQKQVEKLFGKTQAKALRDLLHQVAANS